MPFLINRETGEEEFFIDEEAADLLAQGNYTPAEGERLSVVDEFGNYKNVDAGRYVDYHSQMASTPAPDELTQERREHFRLQDKYDTLGQEIITGIEGGLSGLTLGQSEWILPALGITNKENARHRANINSTVATGSEIGGIVASILLTGGASAEVKGAQLAYDALKAGELASTTLKAGEAANVALKTAKAASTAKKILSYAPSARAMKLGSRIAGRGAEMGLAGRVGYSAAGAAAEGAIFNVGQGISELALSDEELSAERILSSLGSDALIGGGIGGAMGGALPIVGALSRAAWKGTKAGVGKTFNYGKELAEKVGVKLDDYPRLKTLLGGTTKEVEEELLTFKETLSKKLGSFEDGLTYTIRNMADPDITNLRHLTDDIEDVRTALVAGKGSGKLDDGLIDKQIAKIDSGLLEYREANKKFEKLFGGVGSVPERDMFANLANAEGGELTEQIKSIGNYVDSTKKLVDLQEELVVGRWPTKPSHIAKVKEAREALSALEGATKAGGIGPAELLVGADILGLDPEDIPGISSIPFAKELIWLRMLQKRAAGLMGKGLLGKVGLGKTPTSALALKAGEAKAKTAKAVGGFFSKTASSVNKAKVPAAIEILNSTSFAPSENKKYSAKTKEEAFKRRSDEIYSMARNEQLLGQSISRSLGPVPNGILLQVQATMQRKLDFLASKLPKDGREPTLVQSDFTPSSVEIKKFAKYVRAAENPQTVLEDMKNGRLTQEAAETLKVVYPAMFADIQMQIIEALPTLKEKLNYRQKLQLSRLFGIPVDESMKTSFIQAMQADFAGDKEEAAGMAMAQGGDMNLPAMKSNIANSMSSSKPGDY